MIEIINLLFTNPVKGLISFLILFCAYLWREQGKLKTEIQALEKMLDLKKLDKEEFENYSVGHDKVHTSFIEHLKTAIDLLKSRT